MIPTPSLRPSVAKNDPKTTKKQKINPFPTQNATFSTQNQPNFTPQKILTNSKQTTYKGSKTAHHTKNPKSSPSPRTLTDKIDK